LTDVRLQRRLGGAHRTVVASGRPFVTPRSSPSWLRGSERLGTVSIFRIGAKTRKALSERQPCLLEHPPMKPNQHEQIPRHNGRE
jgi:hypothetical protein